MSEKRIKATLHTDKCYVGRSVRVVSGNDDDLPPDGTPVEIVYRDEVEIRPGQKWVEKATGEMLDVLSAFGSVKGCDDWFVAKGGMLSYLWLTDVNGDNFRTKYFHKSELQRWLNEHATLAERES